MVYFIKRPARAFNIIGVVMNQNIKNTKKAFISVVIAAGGSSSRMNGENKLLKLIADKPVLAHTFLAFENCDIIDEIVLSAHCDCLLEYAAIASKYKITKLTKVIKGGNTRLQSVYNAAIEVSNKTNILLVHDAARPLISSEDIRSVVNAARKYNAAAASNKVTDTIKTVENDFSVGNVDRDKLVSVQTPQGGDKALVLAALKKAVQNEDGSVTDECTALEKIGVRPYMVKCSTTNIKITYPEDIFIANAIYDKRCKE